MSRVLVAPLISGCISLWTDGEDYPTKEDPSQHNTAITLLKWSPDGTRLITTDKNGKCCVWGIAGGRLQTIMTAPAQASITHCCFRTHPNGMEAEMPPFFLASRTGLVTYVEGIDTSDAFNVESPVTAILYHEGRDEVSPTTRPD